MPAESNMPLDARVKLLRSSRLWSALSERTLRAIAALAAALWWERGRAIALR